MKNLFFYLLLCFAFGCSKADRDENQLTGKWRLAVSQYSTGSSINTFTPDPQRPVFIEFKSNGQFKIDTTHIYLMFQGVTMYYDRYQLKGDTLNLYKINSNDTLRFFVQLNAELALYHAGCRELCLDTFRR